MGEKASNKKWTVEELDKLKSIVDKYSNKELAEKFSVTLKQLEVCLHRKKIKRDPNFKVKEIKWEIDINGCWNCISHSKNRGYPKMSRGNKIIYLSRHMYEKKFGKISEELIIRHKCDNPACINPDHLETGSYKDNAQDCVKKDRLSKKLTNLQVKEMLGLIKEGWRNKDLAEKFKIDQSIISKIRHGVRWKHITRN